MCMCLISFHCCGIITIIHSFTRKILADRMTFDTFLCQQTKINKKLHTIVTSNTYIHTRTYEHMSQNTKHSYNLHQSNFILVFIYICMYVGMIIFQSYCPYGKQQQFTVGQRHCAN